MAKCVIFVEGSRKTDNGDLHYSFNQLLRQANPRYMPLIVMCNDTAGAIRKFRQEIANPRSKFQQVLLLVDLDGPDDTREAWLASQELASHQANVFFMVQKMEAWFLAQVEVVQEFYNHNLAHALPRAKAALVTHPDRVLERCTSGHRKGSYHKTGHGARLLIQLSLPKLQADFPDVARLVAAL
ncbi:MAG: DUF4276 family protein [Janthinobacterium lividum]